MSNIIELKIINVYYLLSKNLINKYKLTFTKKQNQYFINQFHLYEKLFDVLVIINYSLILKIF